MARENNRAPRKAEENDGLILPLVYPQDFIVTGSVARISNLSSIIKEKN